MLELQRTPPGPPTQRTHADATEMMSQDEPRDDEPARAETPAHPDAQRGSAPADEAAFDHLTRGGPLDLKSLRERRAPQAPPPFGAAELQGALRAPLSVLELVLAHPARLASTIQARQGVGLLAMLLGYVTLVFALPYGAVLDVATCWRLPLLLVGTLAICLPSLHVFSTYIGASIDARQNLALGLVITSVAALFCFGFFPVVWFLRATMLEDSGLSARELSNLLLCVSFAAGVGHLVRCFRGLDALVPSYRGLVAAWLVLFHFIAYRMALLLELGA